MAESKLLWTGVFLFDDTQLHTDDNCWKWNAEIGGLDIAEHFAKALVIGGIHIRGIAIFQISQM